MGLDCSQHFSWIEFFFLGLRFWFYQICLFQVRFSFLKCRESSLKSPCSFFNFNFIFIGGTDVSKLFQPMNWSIFVPPAFIQDVLQLTHMNSQVFDTVAYTSCSSPFRLFSAGIFAFVSSSALTRCIYVFCVDCYQLALVLNK